MAKDAYYFSHDSNARNDPKIVAMMTKYQWFGYGMYWAIIEIMREQDNYKIEANKYTCSSLAMQLHVDKKQAEDFLNDCIDEFKLFEQKNNFIYSKSLLRRMKKKEEVSKKRSEAASKRWNKNNGLNGNNLQSKSNAIALQLECNKSKGKESKGNKNKGKEKESFNPLIDRQKFINNLPDSVYKRGHSKEQVLIVIDSLIDYCKSKGRNYKDYYATLRNFLKNEPVNNTQAKTHDDKKFDNLLKEMD